MMGKQHLAFGAVTGVATALTLNQLSLIDEMGMYGFIGLSMLGSLLPDIDKSNSTLGSIVKPISIILEKTIGHRTYTHDIVFNALLCLISIIYVNMKYPVYLPFVAGLWFGVVGHLLLDSCTINGLPVCYLFNKKLKVHLMPKNFRVYSSESGAVFMTGLFIVLCIGINLLVLNGTVGLTF